MAVRGKQIDADGLIYDFGPNVRVDRTNPLNRDEPCQWIVYRKVDVTDDPGTTYTYRWEPVGSPYNSEEAAHASAAALAEKE